jgi:hypothetical protein
MGFVPPDIPRRPSPIEEGATLHYSNDPDPRECLLCGKIIETGSSCEECGYGEPVTPQESEQYEPPQGGTAVQTTVTHDDINNLIGGARVHISKTKLYLSHPLVHGEKGWKYRKPKKKIRFLRLK